MIADPPYCVYRIDCSATGKAYIGLTKVGADRRFRAHRCNSRRGAGGALYAAMRKYGEDAFTVATLQCSLTLEQAQRAEIEAIAAHATRAPNGYNISLGGDAGLAGVVLTAETRAAMSATHRARQADPELRRRTSEALTGREVPPETREKLRIASTGKPCAPETRGKLRAANLGKTQTPETIAKRSAALAGRPKSAAARANMSAAQQGKPKGDQHRAALSAALKGRKLSPETLAKRAATNAAKRAARG